MKQLESLYQLYENYHNTMRFEGNPRSLYDSMNYIMDLGGKRARPLLTLASCYAVNQQPQQALSLAWAIEGFHNFSLVHDDIMDNADLRRGKSTVHQKFDTNTAILCGDNLLVKVFAHLIGNNSKEVQELFAKTAAEICDGQQMDMEYALAHEVKFDDYLEMIRLKTAVLLGCCAKGGALCAGAEEDLAQQFYDFAIALGLAFQLTDDLLDTFGEQQQTGKKVGGDIAEGKKNAPYILSRQRSPEIEEIYKNFSGDERIRMTIQLFRDQNIEEEIKQVIARFESVYEQKLLGIKQQNCDVFMLEELCLMLSNRQN